MSFVVQTMGHEVAWRMNLVDVVSLGDSVNLMYLMYFLNYEYMPLLTSPRLASHLTSPHPLLTHSTTSSKEKCPSNRSTTQLIISLGIL